MTATDPFAKFGGSVRGSGGNAHLVLTASGRRIVSPLPPRRRSPHRPGAQRERERQ